MRILITLIYALLIAGSDQLITGTIHFNQVLLMLIIYAILMFIVHRAMAIHDQKDVSWFEERRTK